MHFCKVRLSKIRKICYKTYFYNIKFGGYKKKQYLCTVFFMVLDLRLSKRLGCRDDNPSFFIIFHFFIAFIRRLTALTPPKAHKISKKYIYLLHKCKKISIFARFLIWEKWCKIQSIR